MCGLCGIYSKHHNLTAIGMMNHVQRHRGPDDEGYYFLNTATDDWQIAGGDDTPAALNLVDHRAVNTADFDLVLGSRRLAILDLSPAGHMPMTYDNGRLWIAFNGEVYNYRELREELIQLGYTFHSGTDTEVILAAYDEWGTDCLSRFNGMFAFALWDTRQKQLFCARDRFGIKPFYYYWNGSDLVFASEIKSIVQHANVPRQPNDRMIFDYLILGTSDHTDETFFEDIYSLPPAHFFVLQMDSGSLQTSRWWQADINPSVGGKNGRETAVYDEFRHLLTDAVRLRLRSDVAVGFCLSGGLDSSAIVTLATHLLVNEQVIPAELVGNHQKTFTARNRETEIDEYQYSHLIVNRTGAEENLIFPSGDVLWQELERFVWHMDEPVNSTSQYPQWNVMRLARQRGVTVLLDGQGGDEILAGYTSYYPPYINQVYRQRGLLPAAQSAWQVSRIGGAPVQEMLYAGMLNQMPWRLQQMLRNVRAPRSAPGTGGSGLQQWQITDSFLQNFHDRRWQPDLDGDGRGLVGMLYRDLTSTNLPKLLRYEDRNSMAFSLETRLPFLDYRLVEKVFSLPLNYRIHEGWSKWLLRSSMQEMLPKEIVWRRSKLGFPTPELNWLRAGTGTVRHLLQTHADADWLAKYVQPQALRQMSALPDAELAAAPGLWRIVNLIVWYDVFFNQNVNALTEKFAQAEPVLAADGTMTMPETAVSAPA